MSIPMDSESLLKRFGIAYDPGLLAKHRVMFAMLLRKYFTHYRCNYEEYVEDAVDEAHLHHPSYTLVRSCLATAWAEMEDEERRSNYYRQFGGGCSSGSCGPCASSSSCGEQPV